MADIDSRPRKSVAFAEGETIVDSNGEVTQAVSETEKDTTAESHSKTDAAVDEATDDFEALALAAKKKKKVPKTEDGEVDLSALKKKKKKVKAPLVDDFEAKLAAAGGDEEKVLADDAAEKQSAKVEAGLQEGDLIQGTGIWAHDETKPINYESLLSRFFLMLSDSHPDLGGSGMKSYKIPPPQCLREGNKKTIFANIAEICKRMKRTDEHVTQFLFAELGTSGSVDGSRRLVIKGRFQQKQIENVLRRYIGKFLALKLPAFHIRKLTISTVEYVTCKTCRSPDTELNKGENRLYFVTCNSCGSRRSVTAIKTGFSAQVGKRKRMVK
jgi:translation initiation factor 2 subunit 2